MISSKNVPLILLPVIIALIVLLALPIYSHYPKKHFETLKLSNVGELYAFALSDHAQVSMWLLHRDRCVYILKIAIGPNNKKFAVQEIEIRLISQSPFHHLEFLSSDSYKNIFKVIQVNQKYIVVKIREPMNDVLYTFKIIIYDEECNLPKVSIPMEIKTTLTSSRSIVSAHGLFKLKFTKTLLSP